MAEFGGIDKKHWLYIGGAVASIAALFWIMRRSSSGSTMPMVQPARTTGGGASSDATTAAQTAAAAQLAIEKGREDVALRQIQSLENIAALQAYTALEGTRITQSGATSRAGIGALASPTGMAAVGAGAQLGGNIIQRLFDLFTPKSSSSGSIYGPNIPAGWSYNEQTGSWERPGFIGGFGFNGGTIYEQPIGPNQDFTIYNESIGPSYETTTGGGGSSWFGSPNTGMEP